ncbi:MAG: DUF421 domain-containing protein [Clostridia bacterium]|nr:DUF421 domain-containing protein [Clostridia bacterium]
MIVIFLRTVLIYIVLLLLMRLMGKRQIGELQPSELVTTLILSQIASQPIIMQDIPVSYGLVPVCAVVCLEVIASFLMTRVPYLKNLFVGKPSVLIDKGRLRPDEMMRVRLTVEELMSKLRLKGAPDPGEVYYAVMEENGSISVILKAGSSSLCRSDAGVEAKESGISRLVISDGKVSEENLKLLGKDIRWLDKQLAENGLRSDDVFMMTCNDASDVYIVKKQTEGGG